MWDQTSALQLTPTCQYPGIPAGQHQDCNLPDKCVGSRSHIYIIYPALNWKGCDYEVTKLSKGLPLHSNRPPLLYTRILYAAVYMTDVIPKLGFYSAPHPAVPQETTWPCSEVQQLEEHQ